MEKELVVCKNGFVQKRRLAIGFLFFLFLGIAVYHQAIHNGYIWDDDHYVTENSNLHSREGLWNIWLKPGSSPQYYPITFTTFWFEYQIWGLNPKGYHFNNILLHAINAFLLWLILLRLKLPGAFLAAAIFAIHPVHVESVAWITERKNVLSGFFYLSSLISYLIFLGPNKFSNETHNAKKDERNHNCLPYYFISLLFFVFALLSKSVTASLPAVILVLIWWKTGAVKLKNIIILAPFFIVGIGYGVTTAWLEAYHVGATGHEFAYGFLERCLIAGRALWFYIGKLLWPSQLVFIYPRWEIKIAQWWQFVFPISFLIVLSVFYFFRKQIGRGPFSAVLIFSGTLFPAIGFINVFPHRFSFVADHFQYLASAAIIAGLSSWLVLLGEQFFNTKTKMRVAYLMVILLLLNLAFKTEEQTHAYQDVFSLWEDTIEKNNTAWIAYNNLAAANLKINEYEKAVTLAKQALVIRPDYGLAHLNLADAYLLLGEFYAAKIHYQTTLNLLEKSKNNSNYERYIHYRSGPKAYHNLAYIHIHLGEYDSAMQNLENAIEINPDLGLLYKTLGKLYYLRREYSLAIPTFRKALRMLPEDYVLYGDLGSALLSIGDIEGSVYNFRKSLEINPEYLKSIQGLADANAAMMKNLSD